MKFIKFIEVSNKYIQSITKKADMFLILNADKWDLKNKFNFKQFNEHPTFIDYEKMQIFSNGDNKYCEAVFSDNDGTEIFFVISNDTNEIVDYKIY